MGNKKSKPATPPSVLNYRLATEADATQLPRILHSSLRHLHTSRTTEPTFLFSYYQESIRNGTIRVATEKSSSSPSSPSRSSKSSGQSYISDSRAKKDQEGQNKRGQEQYEDPVAYIDFLPLRRANGEHVAFVVAIAVHEKYSQRGIGKMLLQTVEASLAERGFVEIRIRLGDKLETQRKCFEEKMGYEYLTRQQLAREETDAYVMEKGWVVGIRSWRRGERRLLRREQVVMRKELKGSG